MPQTTTICLGIRPQFPFQWGSGTARDVDLQATALLEKLPPPAGPMVGLGLMSAAGVRNELARTRASQASSTAIHDDVGEFGYLARGEAHDGQGARIDRPACGVRVDDMHRTLRLGGALRGAPQSREQLRACQLSQRPRRPHARPANACVRSPADSGARHRCRDRRAFRRPDRRTPCRSRHT